MDIRKVDLKAGAKGHQLVVCLASMKVITKVVEMELRLVSYLAAMWELQMAYSKDINMAALRVVVTVVAKVVELVDTLESNKVGKLAFEMVEKKVAMSEYTMVCCVVAM